MTVTSSRANNALTTPGVGELKGPRAAGRPGFVVPVFDPHSESNRRAAPSGGSRCARLPLRFSRCPLEPSRSRRGRGGLYGTPRRNQLVVPSRAHAALDVKDLRLFASLRQAGGVRDGLGGSERMFAR